MKERLQRFMAGRYGTDELSGVISVCVIVCIVISMFSRRVPMLQIFYLAAILLFVYNCYRMLSKNTAKRYAENQVFRDIRYKAAIKRNRMRTQWAQRDIYRFYKCPNCRQKVRVPKGKGKICITCPKCKTEFVKKS